MIFAEIGPAEPAFPAMNELDVDALEVALLAQPQVDCPVTHHFSPGIYTREAFLPAGTLIVGHAHRDASLNVMLKGKMALLIDGHVSIVEAPFRVIGGPGRKVAYVIEDTVWQNIYATNETDLDKLEEMFIEKSPAWTAHHAAEAIT